MENGGTIEGNFKNGQEFEGNSLAFFDRNSVRYEMLADEEVTPIKPRSGDRPALSVPAPAKDALVVVVHETAPSFVTYTEWDKFLAFVEHKDFADAVSTHDAKNWPRDRFRERYTRHVKALIAVGNGEGTDQYVGLKTEFIALTNPYASDFEGKMTVLLTYEGTPRADAQVEVFDRAPDDSVTITLHRTDAEGTATVPVQPGHEYLFDAVVLEPAPDAETEENAPLWETYWAALTFEVPQ